MSKHFHHALKAPALPDIHLPTGVWDAYDVDCAIDDAKEVKAKLISFFRDYLTDASIYFGASTDMARMVMAIEEEIDLNLINPLEQVRDFIDDEAAGPHRWHQEHSTYRAVNGRVA